MRWASTVLLACEFSGGHSLSVLCAGLQEFEGVKVVSFECILKLSLLEEGVVL